MIKSIGESPRGAVGVGLMLFAVAASVTMTQYKIPTIMTDIIAMFDSDAATVSWLMSVFTFVGIVVAVPTGILLKRIGPRNVVLLAIVVNVLAAVAGSLTKSIGTLLLTRAVEGMSLVFVVAAAPIVIQQYVDPGKVGLSTGIYMLGGMLGATFAGIMTPVLFYGFGYKGLWDGYALLVALCGLVFAVFIRPCCAGTRQPNLPSDDARESCRDDYKIFLSLNTLKFLVPFAVFQMALLTILSFAPTALQQRGLSPAASGLVSTLPMLLAVVSSIMFGAISDRTGRCKFLCVAGLVVLGPCCLFMLNCSGLIMWISLIVMGLFAMGAPTAFVAAYPRILGKPELMSVGMGVLLLVQSCGQFLGTAVSSALLGPSLDQWCLCGSVIMVLCILGALSLALCKFR